MAFYFTTSPKWLRSFFPDAIWELPTDEKTIYLSFDDGPHPALTPFVLQELKKYNANATFFCIGNNVRQFPEIFKMITDEGNSIGNHTMHHVNGFKTADDVYLDDIAAAAKLIPSNLFRPPYGQIKRRQIKKLKAANPNIKIVMWSVIAGDWDATITSQQCFNRIQKAAKPGSIIVLHDSEKAFTHLQYTLPKVLDYFSKLGYSFKAL